MSGSSGISHAVGANHQTHMGNNRQHKQPIIGHCRRTKIEKSRVSRTATGVKDLGCFAAATSQLKHKTVPFSWPTPPLPIFVPQNVHRITWFLDESITGGDSRDSGHGAEITRKLSRVNTIRRFSLKRRQATALPTGAEIITVFRPNRRAENNCKRKRF
jgi:hypothetical protein